MKSPVDSTWTSHRIYLRLAPQPAWLDVELGLHICGFNDTVAGRRQFDAYVREVELTDVNTYTSEPRRHSAGTITSIGTDGRTNNLTEDGWNRLRQRVAQEVGISTAALHSGGHAASRARRLLALVAYFGFGENLNSMARHLRLAPPTVHHLLYRNAKMVEQLRESADRIRADLAALS